MVVYVSHTLGGKTADYSERGNHAVNAYDWLRFLVSVTDWAILMPWQAYITALGELQRPRSFGDQLQILKRCDALVFVGGDLSSHMVHERQVAQEHGIAVLDLTDLGYYPPNIDRIVTLLRARLERALEEAMRTIVSRRTPPPRI